MVKLSRTLVVPPLCAIILGLSSPASLAADAGSRTVQHVISTSNTTPPHSRSKSQRLSAKAKAKKAKAAREEAAANLAVAEALAQQGRERAQAKRLWHLQLQAAALVIASLLLAIFGVREWRARKRAIRRIGELERDLAHADRALEHQIASQADRNFKQPDRSAEIDTASAALAAGAVQRDNLQARLHAREESLRAAEAEIAALNAAISVLKAAAIKRQVASAKTQIQVLKRTPKSDGLVLASKQLLNNDEQRLVPLLQKWADENAVRLLAQVSMGEFLEATKGAHYQDLFATYNSKRVDFLVCNEDWSPRFVVEHFGEGHFGQGYAAQDEVKSRLLNLSDLGLVITLFDDQDADILEKLNRAHLQPTSAVPACNPFQRVMPPWAKDRPQPAFPNSPRVS